MRLIDADALIKTLGIAENCSDCKYQNGPLCAKANYFVDACEAIFDAPTIDPVKWIPVSERLPKNDDWAIVTILDECGDTPYRYTDFGWYLEAANCWIVEAEQRTDVTAWMPLPEPWRGEE